MISYFFSHDYILIIFFSHKGEKVSQKTSKKGGKVIHKGEKVSRKTPKKGEKLSIRGKKLVGRIKKSSIHRLFQRLLTIKTIITIKTSFYFLIKIKRGKKLSISTI